MASNTSSGVKGRVGVKMTANDIDDLTNGKQMVTNCPVLKFSFVNPASRLHFTHNAEDQFYVSRDNSLGKNTHVRRLGLAFPNAVGLVISGVPLTVFKY